MKCDRINIDNWSGFTRLFLRMHGEKEEKELIGSKQLHTEKKFSKIRPQLMETFQPDKSTHKSIFRKENQ